MKQVLALDFLLEFRHQVGSTLRLDLRRAGWSASRTSAGRCGPVCQFGFPNGSMPKEILEVSLDGVMSSKLAGWSSLLANVVVSHEGGLLDRRQVELAGCCRDIGRGNVLTGPILQTMQRLSGLTQHAFVRHQVVEVVSKFAQRLLDGLRRRRFLKSSWQMLGALHRLLPVQIWSTK